MATYLTSRDRPLFLVGLAFGAASLLACSSSSTTTPDAGGPQAPAFNGDQYRNSVQISEADACQRIQQAASNAIN